MLYWSFFYSLWQEKNQNIKVMHYSAALSVFKSTRTAYLLDQHFPPFEFVIKSSSILIVWVFLVLGVVRFQQKKTRTICETHCQLHMRGWGKISCSREANPTDEQTPDLLSWWSFVQWKSVVTSQAPRLRNSWWKKKEGWFCFSCDYEIWFQTNPCSFFNIGV